jgi:hypothetical protein
MCKFHLLWNVSYSFCFLLLVTVLQHKVRVMEKWYGLIKLTFLKLIKSIYLIGFNPQQRKKVGSHSNY